VIHYTTCDQLAKIWGGGTNNIGVPDYEFWGDASPPVFTPML